MNLVFWVAIGGALGALARFGLAALVQDRIQHAFLGVPLSTLLVNVIGSALIGVVYVLLHEKLSLGAEFRAVAMVGFLAAFTTFSTFSLDAVHLLESGHVGPAFAYIIGSVVMCLSVCWLAMIITRSL